VAKHNSKDVPVDTLVMQVMRESYLQASEDLRSYAAKVAFYNESKKALRRYLAELRTFKTDLIAAARERGVDLCRGDKKNAALLAKLFSQFARDHRVGEVEHRLSIPSRVPPTGVGTVERLDATITHMEDQLASIGDDAQLANVDLQNALQKQQQALQMMSNVSKSIHDTMMAIIRNMGG